MSIDPLELDVSTMTSTSDSIVFGFISTTVSIEVSNRIRSYNDTWTCIQREIAAIFYRQNEPRV